MIRESERKMARRKSAPKDCKGTYINNLCILGFELVLVEQQVGILLVYR